MKVVCVSNAIARAVSQQLSNEIERIDQVFVSVSVNPVRFNKFMFIAELLPSIRSFERVMLLDSDMDLMGFP